MRTDKKEKSWKIIWQPKWGTSQQQRQLILTKPLFGSHRHASLYVIILNRHMLLPTSTPKCAVKQRINNTGQLIDNQTCLCEG